MKPAFTCPCHYSTFAPGEGGKVLFGPAGRPLPQLPLMIDADGNLRAAGGVRRGRRSGVVRRATGMSLIGRMIGRRVRRRGALVTSSGWGRRRGISWVLRYVFPDHWSFLLGEIALYAFIVLVGTGIFLTLYYIAERLAGALPRHLSAAPRPADVGGLPVGARPVAQRAGRPSVPPGAPLGGRRVHRRDRACT